MCNFFIFLIKFEFKNINNEVYQEVAANLEQSPMLMKNENGDIYDFNVQTVSLLSKKNV